MSVTFRLVDVRNALTMANNPSKHMLHIFMPYFDLIF